MQAGLIDHLGYKDEFEAALYHAVLRTDAAWPVTAHPRSPRAPPNGMKRDAFIVADHGDDDARGPSTASELA